MYPPHPFHYPQSMIYNSSRSCLSITHPIYHSGTNILSEVGGLSAPNQQRDRNDSDRKDVPGQKGFVL